MQKYFDLLDIEITDDIDIVRRAYYLKLQQVDEENTLELAAIHDAYEKILHFINNNEPIETKFEANNLNETTNDEKTLFFVENKRNYTKNITQKTLLNLPKDEQQSNLKQSKFLYKEQKIFFLKHFVVEDINTVDDIALIVQTLVSIMEEATEIEWFSTLEYIDQQYQKLSLSYQIEFRVKLDVAFLNPEFQKRYFLYQDETKKKQITYLFGSLYEKKLISQEIRDAYFSSIVVNDKEKMKKNINQTGKKVVLYFCLLCLSLALFPLLFKEKSPKVNIPAVNPEVGSINNYYKSVILENSEAAGINLLTEMETIYQLDKEKYKNAPFEERMEILTLYYEIRILNKKKKEAIKVEIEKKQEYQAEIEEKDEKLKQLIEKMNQS